MLIVTGRSDCPQANTIAKPTSHIKAPARNLAPNFRFVITTRFLGSSFFEQGDASKFLHDDDQRTHPGMVHVEQEELFVNLVYKKWVVEAEHRGPDINNLEHEAPGLKTISI